ncbi:MAG: hypothetical protein JXA54_15770 [Candidatus Heimdallarchaeota archaeon]|nr:hypothetical protein [Candidatus Heimdallarchaeota archaeon]
MDILKKMIEERKKELIEAGEIDPSEELTQQEIQLTYQNYQIKKMKSVMGDIGKNLEVKMPKAEKQKKESPPKPEPQEPKEKKVIGRSKCEGFSKLLKELQSLQQSLDARIIKTSELFNILCSSLSPEIAELINDKSRKDFEKKMKDIQEIMIRQVNTSEYGFPAPTDLVNKLNDYLILKDHSNKELNLIYTQMSEMSELMVKSISKMEEA